MFILWKLYIFSQSELFLVETFMLKRSWGSLHKTENTQCILEITKAISYNEIHYVCMLAIIGSIVNSYSSCWKKYKDVSLQILYVFHFPFWAILLSFLNHLQWFPILWTFLSKYTLLSSFSFLTWILSWNCRIILIYRTCNTFDCSGLRVRFLFAT